MLAAQKMDEEGNYLFISMNDEDKGAIQLMQDGFVKLKLRRFDDARFMFR